MLVASLLLLAVTSSVTSALKEDMNMEDVNMEDVNMEDINMEGTGGGTDHAAEKRHVSLVRSLDSAAASVNVSVVVLAGGPSGHW